MESIFKEYDIRALYGTELKDSDAYDIGRAFVTFHPCRKVSVGRDVRPQSEALFRGVTRALTDAGCDVVDLGRCSTPESYFGNVVLGCDAGAMITASHNKAKYNGFKLTKAMAVPISGASGLKEIEEIYTTKNFLPKAKVPGHIIAADISGAYRTHVQKSARLARPVRIAADFLNGMGISEAKALKGLPIVMESLHDTLDGTFPNHAAHGPDPMHADTPKALQEKMSAGKYDFGVIFDGDADRVAFLDETGGIIPMDLTATLMAQEILASHPGEVALYDLRSSWTAREAIAEAGGIAMMCRVGHSYIKEQMRSYNAVFGGELSGHYYFRNAFTEEGVAMTESSATAVLAMANIVSRSEKPLSELMRPLRRYAKTDEINTKLPDRADAQRVLSAVLEKYGDCGELSTWDGIRIETAEWWFSVRCSNTEPKIRLIVEAKTEAMMEEKRDELLALIRGN